MAKHCAAQIIDAVVGKLQTAGIPTYKYRTLSFDYEGELPAVAVRMGPDQPLEVQNLSVIDSSLSVRVVGIAHGSTEETALEQLLELRRAVHQALMADQHQGIPNIVSDTVYAGAAEPETEIAGEGIAARQECTWQIPYRMPFSNPV